jgi:outer membrane protein OmpA-like peptidoglycan-associated protein
MSSATQAAQFAEDARALSVDRQQQEWIAAERAAAAAKSQADREAKAAADAAEASRKADREARREAELAAARQAQIRAEAAALEAQMRMQAKIAAMGARAEANVLQAREESARTDTERGRQAAADLRARLLVQFNRILETRDSPRGLVVTVTDALFGAGKFDLRLDARDRLARFSGIVLAHPGLNLEVEGHTDNTGGGQLTQKLSEQWAQTVRGFLIKLGLPGDSMTAVGFGRELPVADNSAAAGRQKARRVDLIVSGEVIGVKIGK